MADKPKDTSAGKTKAEERGKGPSTVLKELLAIDLSTAFALGRVPMRAFAQKLAHGIKNGLPKDHWLLGDGTETVIALVADRVEKAGKASKSKGFEVTLEATSDFIEAFSQALCGEDDKDDAKRPEKASPALPPPDAELLKKVALLKAEFAADVARLLLEAPPKTDGMSIMDYFAAMDEVLAKRAEVLERQINLLLHGPEKKPVPKVPGVPFSERLTDAARVVDEGIDAVLTPVNNEIEHGLAKWEASLQARRQKMQAREPQKSSLFGRAWKWLSRPNENSKRKERDEINNTVN